MRMKLTSPIERKASAVTSWVGSTSSILTHTVFFTAAFLLAFSGLVSFDRVLLVLTTVVSLEAIYLAIFIQMTVNRQERALAEVEQDLGEIQEDVEEIQDDIEEIQEDVEGIGEDVEELQEDVEDISEDVEEISEDESEEKRKEEQKETLKGIYDTIQKLAADIEKLKK